MRVIARSHGATELEFLRFAGASVFSRLCAQCSIQEALDAQARIRIWDSGKRGGARWRLARSLLDGIGRGFLRWHWGLFRDGRCRCGAF